MGNEIQAIDKANELTSVQKCFPKWCHDTFLLQIYESTIHTIFLSCVVPSFNLKPDDCNLATTILVYKVSQLHKTLILGRLWLVFL